MLLTSALIPQDWNEGDTHDTILDSVTVLFSGTIFTNAFGAYLDLSWHALEQPSGVVTLLSESHNDYGLMVVMTYNPNADDRSLEQYPSYDSKVWDPYGLGSPTCDPVNVTVWETPLYTRPPQRDSPMRGMLITANTGVGLARTEAARAEVWSHSCIFSL